MKNDERLERSFLKYTAGDAMNVLLARKCLQLTQDSALAGNFVCSF